MLSYVVPMLISILVFALTLSSIITQLIFMLEHPAITGLVYLVVLVFSIVNMILTIKQIKDPFLKLSAKSFLAGILAICIFSFIFVAYAKITGNYNLIILIGIIDEFFNDSYRVVCQYTTLFIIIPIFTELSLAACYQLFRKFL